VFSTDAVTFDFCWGATATSGFVIPGSSGPVVDPHEASILRKFSDEFAYAVSLSCSRYGGDGHESLLRGSMDPVGNLVQSLIEVPDGKRFPEPPASIGPLSIAVAPSVLVFGSLICGCISSFLVC
jgi:hypothetical protein